MNPNARIVILVFDEVIPRFLETATNSETLAQAIARRYQESDDVENDDLESRGVSCFRSRDVTIVH